MIVEPANPSRNVRSWHRARSSLKTGKKVCQRTKSMIRYDHACAAFDVHWKPPSGVGTLG